VSLWAEWCSVQLSEKRRATVDMFKGKAYVNVREYYTVDGEDSLKPGKKGLSMLTDQFRALVAGADAVDAAVAAGGQLGVVVSLSETRRVTVMEHSGVVMVRDGCRCQPVPELGGAVCSNLAGGKPPAALDEAFRVCRSTRHVLRASRPCSGWWCILDAH